MPRRSPFTRLCQAAAALHSPRADLHIHSTASDGDFTPSQIVAHARHAGLGAIAITDHDTFAGYDEASTTRFETRNVEVLRGVEISSRFDSTGYHLLAYAFEPQLDSLLVTIRHQRRERFHRYLEDFRVDIPDHLLTAYASPSIAVGRRHLAKLLVAAGHANTMHLAFVLHILPCRVDADHSVPFADAIAAVHAAGGVTSLAHPPSEFSFETLREMHAIGLDGLETNAPSIGYERSLELAVWADSLGMIVTAGSDYHGAGHTLGSRTVSLDQLAALRERAACRRG